MQWALCEGELVHVSEVDSGLACNCRCPVCDSRLVARKGEILVHHFAHYEQDCATGAESALHLAAKNIIVSHRGLAIDDFGERVFISFADVRDEVVYAAENGSRYQVDLEARTKSGRRCLIEICVTHAVDETKTAFFREMNLPLLEIVLDRSLHFHSREEFADYLLHRAPQTWLHNPKRTRLDSVSRYQSEEQDQRRRRLAESRAEFGKLLETIPSVGDQLYYGTLGIVDLHEYGIPFYNALCVYSSILPEEFGHLAKVHPHGDVLSEFAGRRAGFRIFSDPTMTASKLVSACFPLALVCWVEELETEELRQIKGDRKGRWMGYSFI